MILTTLNHKIDTQALTLSNSNNNPLVIRPKTCQLLIYLLEHAGVPTSKQTLLETVWAGSVVSEQVVFQSINEIRRLFPNEEVIKTIPQQGYVWLPDVHEQQGKLDNKPTRVKGLLALFTVMPLLIAIIFIASSNKGATHREEARNNASGSIVILPTENQIAGNDHTWVRLGVMDQVIQRLPNTDDYLVLQADYVLEVLKRADIQSKQIQNKDIQQLFMVSGAELIVSSKLAGSPHDYKLIYTFHYRNSVKRGVILHKQLQQLIDDFSLLVASQLNQPIDSLNSVNYQADFNNELLGAAVESSLERNYPRAKSLLESIILDEPNNLTAQRLMVGVLFRLKQFEQANSLIDHTLSLARAQDDKDELARLLHSRALYYYVTMRDKEANEAAKQALNVATEHNDWLLMAYITNIQANVALNEQDYELAEALYKKEQSYHKVLHCPVGEANSWRNLARVAAIKNQKEDFSKAIDKAINIAETRGLKRQLSYFRKVKGDEFN